MMCGQGRGRTADLPLFRCRRCPGRRDRRSVDGCPRAPLGGTGCRRCRHGCRHATESMGGRCQVVSMLRTGRAAPGRPGQAARPARARPDGALPTQARLDLAVHNGLFVPKPTSDVDCQSCGVPDLGSDVHRRPLASAAGGSDSYSLGYSILVRAGMGLPARPSDP
jgi:hypothetical protein